MPLSALMVLLGWAEDPGSAGSRSCRKAGSACMGEGEERGPSTSRKRAHGHGPYREPGGQEGWSSCWGWSCCQDTRVQPVCCPCSGMAGTFLPGQ